MKVSAVCRLPGKAYTRRQHVWLTGVNEVDSKVFSRAILAKVRMYVRIFLPVPLLYGRLLLYE